jgi:cell division protein FtsW (lipid II flippase)
MSEVFAPGAHTRRRELISLGALAGLATLVAMLGWAFKDWPWFAIDAIVLLVLAIAFSIPSARGRVWLANPFATWTALAILSALFAIHSYSIELFRQRSDRFDVLGVRIPAPPNTIVKIGADESADIRLAMPDDSITRWMLSLRRTDSDQFEVLSMEGIDGIQQIQTGTKFQRRLRSLQAKLGFRGSKWINKTGVPISRNLPPALIRSSSNGLIDYRIGAREWYGRPVLYWNTNQVALQLPDNNDQGAQVYNKRMLSRLRSGIPLDELPWPHLPDSTAARELVLFLAKSPRRGLSRVRGFGDYEFQLTSRSPDWVFGPAQPVTMLTQGDSVQVFSNGYRWVFNLQLAFANGASKGLLEARFGTGPSPRLGWLPASAVCDPISRCTLVSNQPLPPAIPYFDISSFGLDTTKFSFLGRLTSAGNQLQLVTPQKVYSADGDTTLVVAAQPKLLAYKADYLFKVTRLASSGLRSLILTLLGFGLLLVGLSRLPRLRSHYGILLRQNTISVNAAWGLANIGIVLLGLRLAFGYRVTYAAPYAERGADTAVGLCLTVILVSAVLLSWSSWAPSVIRFLLRAERAAVAPAATRDSRSRTQETMVKVGTLERRSLIFGVVASAIGLALVAFERPLAAGASVAISLAILACWIMVEYLGSQQTESSIATSPVHVLDMEEPDPDPGRITALAFASLGLPVSFYLRGAAFPMTIVLAFFVVAGVVFIRRKQKKLGAKAGLSLVPFSTSANTLVSTRRLGAPIVVLVFLILLNGLLIFYNGPAVLFIGVFFLFLITIRLGHHVGVALYQKKRFTLSFSLLVLLGTVGMLLPIDFGLVLVVGVPLLIAFLMTLKRVGAIFWIPLGLAAVFLVFSVWPVLFPDASRLRSDRPAVETSNEFGQLGGWLSHVAKEPVRRSLVRALAARNPDALELVLARSAPSLTREQVVPALEQIWGGRAYAASGLTGKGLANQTAIGRGVAVPVSYAENTFSVYVLAEHGFLGGLVVLACYLALIIGAFFFVWRVSNASDVASVPGETALAVVVGGVLMLTVPALYVAAANVGVVPLTGQNMPFLGLNAWSDVVFVAALFSAILAMLLDTSALRNRTR